MFVWTITTVPDHILEKTNLNIPWLYIKKS